MGETVLLSNGAELRNLCFGTDITRGRRAILKDIARGRARRNWKQISNNWVLPKMVKLAMENGCSMFDTSRAYGNSERMLGVALKQFNREDYCVVTKLDNQSQFRGDVCGALESSLKELGMDYVDVYLMHWPVPDHYLNSWKEMEELYKSGLCKAIGVCNCNIHHLEAIAEIADVMPMVNEFECHPLFTQDDLRAYCRKHDIQVMAYTSTARMDKRLANGDVHDISEERGVSMAQVILRWHQQIGNIPIVNSSNKKHLIDNCGCGNFTLTEDEVARISALNINSRLRYDPENCNFRRL